MHVPMAIGIVIIFTFLDLEQNSSFLDGLYVRGRNLLVKVFSLVHPELEERG